jgi:hypothetical protein
LLATQAGDGPLATSFVDSLLFDDNYDVDAASAPLLEPALLDALLTVSVQSNVLTSLDGFWSKFDKFLSILGRNSVLK